MVADVGRHRPSVGVCTGPAAHMSDAWERWRVTTTVCLEPDNLHGPLHKARVNNDFSPTALITCHPSKLEFGSSRCDPKEVLRPTVPYPLHFIWPPSESQVKAILLRGGGVPNPSCPIGMHVVHVRQHWRRRQNDIIEVHGAGHGCSRSCAVSALAPATFAWHLRWGRRCRTPGPARCCRTGR